MAIGNRSDTRRRLETIEGNVPLTVDFINNSVGDNLTYSWDFGDGRDSTSTDASPQHTYNQLGTFNVALTVTNTYGSNSKRSQVVVIQDTGDDQRDTGTRDTETRDTGTRDTGTRDTGTRDTGTRDTGTRDTGTRDTGTRDTETRDTGRR